MLIMMRNVKDADVIRFVVHSHVATVLPRYLQRIRSARFADEDAWELSFTYNQYIDMSRWTAVKDCHDLLYFEDDATKNTSLLMYVYIKYLINLLLNSIQDEPATVHHTINTSALTMAMVGGSDITKQRMALMAHLIHDSMVMLVDAVLDNDIDVSHIRKKVEELREQRKQDLISLYRIDDDERQLQMTLKTMGVATWFNVGPTADEDTTIDLLQPDPQQISLTENRNKMQEEENYNMGDYQGENADDNGDEAFEDYPSQFIFSEDRDP
jgi:hypothetical protein